MVRTGRRQTVEIDPQLISERDKLPARARRGEASAPIVAILARRYPCSTPITVGGWRETCIHQAA